MKKLLAFLIPGTFSFQPLLISEGFFWQESLFFKKVIIVFIGKSFLAIEKEKKLLHGIEKDFGFWCPNEQKIDFRPVFIKLFSFFYSIKGQRRLPMTFCLLCVSFFYSSWLVATMKIQLFWLMAQSDLSERILRSRFYIFDISTAIKILGSTP